MRRLTQLVFLCALLVGAVPAQGGWQTREEAQIRLELRRLGAASGELTPDQRADLWDLAMAGGAAGLAAWDLLGLHNTAAEEIARRSRFRQRAAQGLDGDPGSGPGPSFPRRVPIQGLAPGPGPGMPRAAAGGVAPGCGAAGLDRRGGVALRAADAGHPCGRGVGEPAALARGRPPGQSRRGRGGGGPVAGLRRPGSGTRSGGLEGAAGRDGPKWPVGGPRAGRVPAVCDRASPGGLRGLGLGGPAGHR